jgi:Family of unknown function (DUF6498)
VRKFFDPELMARTYRDPLAMANLAVDLLPLIAVIAFGWGATPLVALYWLENLLLGAFTLARMVASAITHIGKLIVSVFTVPFFCAHYGMFCFVHGMFVRGFASMRPDGSTGVSADADYRDLVTWALGSGPGMVWFLIAIGLVMLAYFARDFILRGQYKTSDPGAEMFAPYGRVITLHMALLLGAVLTFGLDQPLLGVLALIFLRVVFGIVFAVRRRLKLEMPVAPALQKVDAM